MKRLYLGFISILISFSMIGCNSSKDDKASSQPEITTTETTPEETSAEETQATTVRLPLESVSVEKNILEKTIADDDGSTLIKASYELPVIINENNDAVIQKINDYYENASESWFEQLEAESKLKVKDAKVQSPDDFTAYTYEISFEVTYDKNGILSILQLVYENSGGAHPLTYRISEAFDLDTGESVPIEDILNGSADEISLMISEGFTALINENPKKYYKTAKKIMADGALYGGFYLTDSSVKIFYQTEVIAPYAAGYPEIELDYIINADKFKKRLN